MLHLAEMNAGLKRPEVLSGQCFDEFRLVRMPLDLALQSVEFDKLILLRPLRALQSPALVNHFLLQLAQMACQRNPLLLDTVPQPGQLVQRRRQIRFGGCGDGGDVLGGCDETGKAQ
jgi:hypothetical protein